MSLPPSDTPLGAIRFNSDSQKLEYWMGSAWMQIKTFSPNLDGGGRGLVAGGNFPDQSNSIQFVTISIGGNSTDFGDLVARRQANPGATGSSTRAVIGGGQEFPANSNRIEFVTFSSTGNASEFGDLTVIRNAVIGTGNQTRGVFGGGETPKSPRCSRFCNNRING